MTAVEICVDSPDGVLAAAAGGAQRSELCANLALGGTTPSAGAMRVAAECTSIEIVCLVRPRGGDFLYTSMEFEAMQADVIAARDAGLAGVAIGCLRADGSVDAERCARLIELAGELKTCFHRAFDVTSDAHAALEQLIALGFDRVLSSGQEPTAEQGAALLRDLVRQAGDRIDVVPAGGIRPHNVLRVVRETGADQIHCSALSVTDSAMQYRNPRVAMGSSSAGAEYQAALTDAVRVRAIVAALA